MRLVCKSKHRNVPRLWADIFIQLLILLGRVTVRRLLSARINCRKEKQDKVAALNRIRLWKSSGSWTVVFFFFFSSLSVLHIKILWCYVMRRRNSRFYGKTPRGRQGSRSTCRRIVFWKFRSNNFIGFRGIMREFTRWLLCSERCSQSSWINCGNHLQIFGFLQDDGWWSGDKTERKREKEVGWDASRVGSCVVRPCFSSTVWECNHVCFTCLAHSDDNWNGRLRLESRTGIRQEEAPEEIENAIDIYISITFSEPPL